jgi:hypothetical protein
MTEDKEAKRRQIAAIAAMMGMLVFGPRIKEAKGDSEATAKIADELGAFVLEMIDPAHDKHI